MTSIYFKVKDTVDIDMHRVLEIFFKDWVDDVCDNQVKIIKIEPMHLYRVEFNHQEDAVAVKLKGLPEEFHKYLEIFTDYLVPWTH